MALPAHSLQGLYILFLQDDAIDKQRLSEVLQSAGATVITVRSLQAARQSLQCIRPHVILCQARLPEGRYAAFIRQFRTQDVRARRLPIIALVSLAAAAAAPVSRRASDFQGSLTQPFEVAQLIQLIQSVTQHPVPLAEAPLTLRPLVPFPTPPLAS